MASTCNRPTPSLLILIALVYPTACAPPPGAGPGGGDSASSGKLPWSGSFTEAAPAGDVVLTLATEFESEMQARVPDAVRREIADQMAVALAGKPAIRSTMDDPPLYEVDPQTESDAYMMAGVGAIFQGSWSAGAWAFAQAVLSDPDDPYALNQLGWALLADGRLDEAKSVLLRALEIDPQLWTAWSSLGTLYEQSGDPHRAAFCYQMALQSHPDSLFINLKLGALLLAQGNLNGAALHAETALAINPDSDEARELQESVEEAGGAVDPEPPADSGGSSSSVRSQVTSQIFDCAEEHTQEMMTALVPMVRDAISEGYAHRDNRIRIQDEHRECNQDCSTRPMDEREGCQVGCDLTYCSTMASAIGGHHNRQMDFLAIELAQGAAYRARYQSCSYAAIEDSIAQLSHAEATHLYEFIDWQVRAHQEGDRGATDEEVRFYLDELAGISSVCDAEEMAEAVEEVTVENAPALFDAGMEACADGFFCLTFGETSVGFSVGVGVASGGLTADYATHDLIFSLGVGADTGVAAVGLDAKLSIQHGFGLSPVIKYGGPIRATISRDFWLLSF